MTKKEPISIRETANHGFVVEAMSASAACVREEYAFADLPALMSFLDRHFPAPVEGVESI